MQPIAIHTKSANLTEEQFFMLCTENKELKFERDKYQNIIVMAPTGGTTANRNSELNGELIIWNRKYKSGFVFDSNGGFTLPNKAVRAADAAWIKKERWEKLTQDDQDRFPHICPDFVIELMSKSDSLKDTKLKMEEWIENGCRLGWLIDIENKTTLIYKPNSEITEQSFSSVLFGENVLEGFELKLSEIIN